MTSPRKWSLSPTGRMSFVPVPVARTADTLAPLALRGTRPPFWLMRCAIRSAWFPQADLSNDFTDCQARSERNFTSRLGGMASSLLGVERREELGVDGPARTLA